MTSVRNRYGQPVGPPVVGWTACRRPPATPMPGRFCRLEPFDAVRHGPDLYAAHASAPDDRDWTYLPDEKPAGREAFADWCAGLAASTDPMHHAIIDSQTGRVVGSVAFLHIEPANGTIEVGAVNFSPLVQRHAAGTEALFLMMRRAFDELGYRRFEWKCDALNAPSRAAALRYGFQYEGIFRQAVVVKGRTRDTAWYSVTDTEWPTLRGSFEQWLSPGNFDQDGRQVERLGKIRERMMLPRAG